MQKIQKYFKIITNKKNSKIYFLIVLTTFIAKFLGLIKQPFLISRLGSVNSDLLLSSDKLSQIITGFLVAGTIYGSLLPIFSDLLSQSKEKYLRFVKLSTILLTLVITSISGIIWIFIDKIIPYIIDNNTLKNLVDTNQYSTFVVTTKILLIIPSLMTIQTVIGVYLNLKSKVFWFNFSGLLTNICILIGLLVSNNYLYIAIFSLSGWVISNIILLIEAFSCGLIPKIKDLYITKNIKAYRLELAKLSQLIFSKIFLLDLTTLALVLISPFKQFDGQIAAFDLGITLQNSLLFLMLNYNYIIFPQISAAYYENKSTSFFSKNLPKIIKTNLAIGILALFSTIILSKVLLETLSFSKTINQLSDYIQNIVFLGLPTIIFSCLKDVVLKQLQIVKDIKISQILNILSLTIFGIFFLLLHIYWSYDSGYALMISLNFAYLPWLGYLIKIIRIKN
jgi:hypothetical protein